MRITAVEPIHLRVPVVDEIPDGTLDVLVVKIHTDEGLTGIGEVTSQSYVCKACFEAPRSAARRHGLTSILLGEDPRDIERLWQKMSRRCRSAGSKSHYRKTTARATPDCVISLRCPLPQVKGT